jgi:hypothetical protein
MHYALHIMAPSQEDRDAAGRVKEDPKARKAQQAALTWGMERPFYLSMVVKFHQVHCRHFRWA